MKGQKKQKLPWAGFELLTIGVASSDEDHHSMPLPPSSTCFFGLPLCPKAIKMSNQQLNVVKWFFILFNYFSRHFFQSVSSVFIWLQKCHSLDLFLKILCSNDKLLKLTHTNVLSNLQRIFGIYFSNQSL